MQTIGNESLWTALTAFALALLVVLAPGAVRAADGAAPGSATAKRFVEAINAADGAALNAMLDVDALGARVLRNLDLNAVGRAGYLAGLRTQYAALGFSVAAQMQAQNATATLLTNAPVAADDQFMARITTTDARGNQAHGYLQVELGPDGRIVDWYDHAMALSMSGQLAFNAAGMLTTAEVAQLFFGKAGDALATTEAMQLLTRALVAGDLARAHAVLDQMPESIKSRREFALMRVGTSRAVGMQAYRRALADLAEGHGEADDLQFILIDHYLLTAQYEQALKAIDRAALRVGDDEVMDTNRCHALLELGRKADALAACDRAIAKNPKFETPRWTRVRLALKTEDAPLAIESLNGTEVASGRKLDAKDIAGNEIYAWLIAQPEFLPWAAERGWAPP